MSATPDRTAKQQIFIIGSPPIAMLMATRTRSPPKHRSASRCNATTSPPSRSNTHTPGSARYPLPGAAIAVVAVVSAGTVGFSGAPEHLPDALHGVGGRLSAEVRGVVRSGCGTGITARDRASLLHSGGMEPASGSTSTYRAWQRLSHRPGGGRLFSVAAALRVPYFSTILGRVVAMAPGYAEVKAPKWFLVHNHLHTVHAIAMCNAAEMAMAMAMEATVPTTHRWIPSAMTVHYLHKATTSLRACARLAPPDFAAVTDGTEVIVAVSIYDRHGTELTRAEITTWVTPAP